MVQSFSPLRCSGPVRRSPQKVAFACFCSWLCPPVPCQRPYLAARRGRCLTGRSRASAHCAPPSFPFDVFLFAPVFCSGGVLACAGLSCLATATQIDDAVLTQCVAPPFLPRCATFWLQLTHPAARFKRKEKRQGRNARTRIRMHPLAPTHTIAPTQYHISLTHSLTHALIHSFTHLLTPHAITIYHNHTQSHNHTITQSHNHTQYYTIIHNHTQVSETCKPIGSPSGAQANGQNYNYLTS